MFQKVTPHESHLGQIMCNVSGAFNLASSSACHIEALPTPLRAHLLENIQPAYVHKDNNIILSQI